MPKACNSLLIVALVGLVGFSLLCTTAKAEPLTLKVVKVDSEETESEDGHSSNAVDNDPNTYWHTHWGGGESPACPHEITLQLAQAGNIKGITYLPRQDGGENGMIKDYEVYLSADGKDFGQPVAKGTFAKNADLKTVTFDAKKCGFIKIRALSEVNGNDWTSAAEIGVVMADDKAEKPADK